MEISELGEFGLIERLTKGLEPVNESTLRGVGDDCAVLACGEEGRRLLVTTDLLVERVHFDLRYTPLRHLGYKAVMVNISDVCAMNAKAQQLTVGLALDGRFTVEDMEELYDGMRLACKKHAVDLVGGDTTTTPSGLVISITALGEAREGDITYRSGAKPNDLIYVSGDLGSAYMGLQLLQRETAVLDSLRRESMAKSTQGADKGGGEKAQTVDFAPDFGGHDYLLERQLRPEARVDIVEELGKAGIVPTSMIDISDGLSSELMHLCRQSHTGCRVYEERIPLDYHTAAAAEEFDLNVYTCALNGGEDYELLLTVPLALRERMGEIPGLTLIGHMTEEGQGLALITRDSKEFPLTAQGWNPLAAD